MAGLAPQLTAGFEFKLDNSEPASGVAATPNLCYHQVLRGSACSSTGMGSTDNLGLDTQPQPANVLQTNHHVCQDVPGEGEGGPATTGGTCNGPGVGADAVDRRAARLGAQRGGPRRRSTTTRGKLALDRPHGGARLFDFGGALL
ncbi:hypothetical protein CTA2_523 [Colletotrichum tanaceti]|nr:hypothetical protein CTA2_523 [Colletotrichum tanaceti]